MYTRSSNWTLKGKMASLLLLAILGLLVYYFSSSYSFFIYEAEVVGNHFVSAEEINQSSGLEGKSIFWIDPTKVEAAVARLPAVKEARVSCHLPGKVTIKVTERQPQLLWQHGETSYWVDGEGIVMLARGELEGLLLVEDLSSQPQDQLEPAAVQAALQLKSLLPELTGIQYLPKIGISFRNQRGWLIYLGIEDMAKKVAVMRALISHLLAKNIQPELIDLRYKRPYYK